MSRTWAVNAIIFCNGTILRKQDSIMALSHKFMLLFAEAVTHRVIKKKNNP
jgi:hypothetical protein